MFNSLVNFTGMDVRNLEAFCCEFFSALPESQTRLAQTRQTCFQNLDAPSRRVLRLRRFEGLGFQEIAERIAKTQEEVEAIWYEGLERLHRASSPKEAASS